MLSTVIPALTISALMTLNPFAPEIQPILAGREISLEQRYAVASVNEVMKFNILLTMKNMGYSFRLEPGQTFAYHDTVLPKYKDKVVKTSNSTFGYSQGFKSDGYLVGDGVCHLASLMTWTAREAGLEVDAPVRHDFAAIPQVDPDHGTSILSPDQRQNLYITNNKDFPVEFVFEYQSDGDLNLKILEVK